MQSSLKHFYFQLTLFFQTHGQFSFILFVSALTLSLRIYSKTMFHREQLSFAKRLSFDRKIQDEDQKFYITPFAMWGKTEGQIWNFEILCKSCIKESHEKEKDKKTTRKTSSKMFHRKQATDGGQSGGRTKGWARQRTRGERTQTGREGWRSGR